MMFSETPIVPQVSLAVGGVEQHARDRAGAVVLVEDAHLVVDELDVGAGAGCSSVIASRSARSSAFTGPLPSAVRTKRSPSTQILIVASVWTLPSSRFSVITRKLSSRKSGS